MEAAPILIERLNALVSQLPPQQVQEVLDFAGYLLTKESQQLTGATNVEDDPALQIIGLFDSGVDDLAENHDIYLAKFYAKDNNE